MEAGCAVERVVWEKASTVVLFCVLSVALGACLLLQCSLAVNAAFTCVADAFNGA